MERQRRGDGGRAVREAAQDPAVFASCRRRLERAIENSCEVDSPWAPRVADAIRAGLEFAESEPVAARILTVQTAYRRYGRSDEFAEMVDDLAARLAAGAPPARYPERTARNVVLRVMRQALLQLELSGGAPAAIAPEMVVFALTPYVGLPEAQRWAEGR